MNWTSNRLLSLGALRAGLCVVALILTVPGAAAAADGFATSGGSVTGGAGGPSVTVSTLADLSAAIVDDVPRIVNVSGTINLGTSNVRFGSNKTMSAWAHRRASSAI